jgi:hypothetical protein
MNLEQLKSYALAASAAGVSLAALSQPADAHVIIRTHISIPITGMTSIDFNKDGIPDVRFSAFSTQPSGNVEHYDLYVRANGIDASSGSAQPLLRSANIGPSQHFSSAGRLVQTNCSTVCTYRGKWRSLPQNRFLGIKFQISGKTHYGWIRVTVKSAMNATITEYGYETIANKSLKAGLRGASLGDLARGTADEE